MTSCLQGEREEEGTKQVGSRVSMLEYSPGWPVIRVLGVASYLSPLDLGTSWDTLEERGKEILNTFF